MLDLATLPQSFFFSRQVGYKWGKSSFLLLNAVYYKYSREEKYFNNLEIILTDIITHIEECNLEGRDYEELADFCRVLFFLERIAVLDLSDYKSITDPILSKLRSSFFELLKGNEFHFCRGILVFANLYIEAPSSFGYFEEELSLIVAWIDRNRYVTNNETFYWKNANPNFQDKIYLSSILGTLSVCKFLLKMQKRGDKKAEKLLHRGLRFVVSQIKHDQNGLKIITDPIDKIKADDVKPMLQWVEGSFSVLFSLIVDFKDYLYVETYDFIYKNLLLIAKLTVEDVECPKNSIGYGSMGIALMFNKLYRLTGNKNFKQPALYWYHTTLRRMSRKEPQFDRLPDSVRLTGFITGYTGIYTVKKLFEENQAHLIDDLIYI